MLLTHKAKLNINKEQEEILNLISNEGRVLYNHFLAQKVKHYEETKQYLSYFIQQKELKDYKTQYLTFDVKKEILRVLDNNYKSYFSCLKNKTLKPQIPKFRGEKYFFTLSFTQDFLIKDDLLIVSYANRGRINFKLNYITPIKNKICLRNKTIESEIKQVKIIKQKNSYYACITYEQQQQVSKNKDKSFISIDLGQFNLISYYDVNENKGVIYSSKNLNYVQQHYDKRIDKLKSKRDLKKKGSKGRLKITNKLQSIQNKKKNTVKTALHKLSKEIVNLDKNIIIGELTNLKQNTISFNKEINRQKQNNWNLRTITDLLEYKQKLKGNELVKVNEAWTSKTCSNCGNINHSLALKHRTYECSCGNKIDRDINAAINIWKVYENNSGDYHSPINFSEIEEFKRYDWVETPSRMKLSY